jgi:hypothetical protein
MPAAEAPTATINPQTTAFPPFHPQGLKQAVHAPVEGDLRIDVDGRTHFVIFFLADVQTGLGPFLAAYLAANNWNPARVGYARSPSAVLRPSPFRRPPALPST